MSKQERLQALRILLQVIQDKKPLTHLLQSDEAVSPFTKLLCFGVCRQYYRLQKIADKLVDKRPQTLDVWLILLLGLYQLQYLDKPEYATVQETVALMDKIKKSWAKGLVNAVLRRFCRERVAILASLENNPEFVYGHPEWLIRRFQSDWPLDWQSLALANDQHPPMSLRVNQQRTTRAEYLQRLSAAGIAARAHDFSSVGLSLAQACDVSELPDFSSGFVSVQDEAAQLAPSLLALAPGLRVLDACCAPGGKTCHILEAEPALGECVALDIDPYRLQRVRENLARLNLSALVVEGDALLPDTWWDGQLFDRILLDAPCSATGVIRRHPDIKLLRTEEEIAAICKLQASLLHSLWPLLKQGGLMVYATCSVMNQENEQQIANFLAQQKDAHFVSAPQNFGHATGHGWQLIPGQSDTDGFFYSVLQKIEAGPL